MWDEFTLDNSNLTDNDYYSAVTKNNKEADLLITQRKWFQKGSGAILISNMSDEHLCNTMSWLSSNRASVYRWSDHLFNMQREHNRRVKDKLAREHNTSV